MPALMSGAAEKYDARAAAPGLRAPREFALSLRLRFALESRTLGRRGSLTVSRLLIVTNLGARAGAYVASAPGRMRRGDL